MGDPLGSPRVAPPPPLFDGSGSYYFSSNEVRGSVGSFLCLDGHRDMLEGFGVVWELSGRPGGPQAPRGSRKLDGDLRRIGHKRNERGKYFGCDHTSTNAPDPIRTPQLSVLGRE